MESTRVTRPTGATERKAPSPSGILMAAAAVLPLILLAALIFVFANFGNLLTGPSPVPADALGKLDVERLAFRSDGIVAYVVNTGPSELTIAQVLVNEAIWNFAVEPDTTIPRLGRATVTMPYLWLEGEPYKVSLITGNGLKFEKEVAIASATPQPTAAYFGTFALLGLYAGVIPVFLGLLWWPFLRQLSRRWMGFLISLTTGVLVFLGVDVLFEAREIAERVPGPYQGVALIVIGVLLGAGALVLAGQQAIGTASRRGAADPRLVLAYMIAVGIGLHNFGEGLAIGAAYILGEMALGALLVVGFTVHNTTEGIAIIGPISRDRLRLWHLVAMGAIAGVPTVLGSVIGGLAYSDILGTLFLALGAGAIFYVIYELGKLLLRPAEAGRPAESGSLANFAGLIAGLLLMYVTGLFIAV